MDISGIKFRLAGFTLIELMIVVAVIGILSSVAYPSYTEYVRRSKLTDATGILATYKVQIEQSFQDNKSYGTASAACTAAAPAATSSFTFSCLVGATNDTYIATAASKSGAGLGNSAGDYTFTVNQTNTKGTSKFGGSTSTLTCWQVKASGC